jgi:hypothetical protein
VSNFKSRLILTVTLLTGVLFLFYAASRGQTPAGGYSSPQLGGSGGGLPAGLTFVAPTLTVSTAGSGNGTLALSGNTSGTSTFTAPAVAGTVTNPVTMSNILQGPNGANATGPTYGFTNCVTCGMYLNGSSIQLNAQSGNSVNIGTAGSTLYGFFSNEIQPLNNSSTVGDSTHSFKPSFFQGIISSGTTFTAAGCSNSTLVGGPTVGTYTSGTTGACTVTITMGNAATSTTGWACYASDRTTPANIQSNSASTTTTATITGTTVTGDVISFGCLGY